MTTTWSQSIERAFDLRRAWRSALRTAPGRSRPTPLEDVDILVLSLVLDQIGVERIVCADDALRELLAQVFVAVSAPIELLAASDGGRHLGLVSFARLSAAEADAPGCAVCLLYGLHGVLTMRAPPSTTRSAIRLLAAASPALWRCGLAIAVAPEGDEAGQALVTALGLAMRGEWIDPLALYEKVQQLTAQLRIAGATTDIAADVEGDRIARLEFEITSLKRSALLRQHMLLVEAAQRASGVS